MRNITASVPDDVYTSARIYAARHNTSVSAMFAHYLFSLRTIARKNVNITPGAAADLHCDLLAARPSDLPRTAREIRKLEKAFLGE